MGKRYKKGNHGKKRGPRRNQIFYEREKEINRKILHFKLRYYNLKHPLSIQEYREMNALRLEIKRLLTLQSQELHKQSLRRRRFYYNQVEEWKVIYPKWKRKTYYIFLHEVYDVPLHLLHPLKYFRKTNLYHGNGNI